MSGRSPKYEDAAVAALPVADDEGARPLAILLRPRRGRLVRLLLTAAALGAAGLLGDGIARWLCCGFFLACAVVVAVLLLPGASCLRIAPEGFTCVSLFRATLTQWRDVRRFGVVVVAGREMVGYDLTAPDARRSRLGAISAGLVGMNAALPDTYGLTASALAALLTESRRRALRGS